MNLKSLSLAFTAGAVGGLANAIAIWGMGQVGATTALGVSMVPDWSPAYLYPRLVWGGIWGFMFILPILERSILVS